MEPDRFETPTVLQPFACPNCGGTEWTAHYMVPESQGVELFLGEDGKPESGDYDGATKSYDAGADDFYECGPCGTFIDGDGKLAEACATGSCTHEAHGPQVCATCGDLRENCTGDGDEG